MSYSAREKYRNWPRTYRLRVPQRTGSRAGRSMGFRGSAAGTGCQTGPEQQPVRAVHVRAGRPLPPDTRGLSGLLAGVSPLVLAPPEAGGHELLPGLCRGLVAADPARRFASAQAADVGRKGAADCHRRLVKTDLASEYDHDIRAWLEQLA